MSEFFIFFRNCIFDISAMLDMFSFDIGGINVTILDIFFGLIAVSMVISIFWKGARA